jgi:hypothetical protein
VATNETLRSDVSVLLTEAKRSGQIAVNRKVSEAAVEDASGASRVGFTVLEAVEGEAGKFIAEVMPAYRGATSTQANGATAKAIVRDAVESYLEASKGWGQSSPAFGDGRNALLDHGPMCERVREKLELEMRLFDTKSRQPSWGGHAVAIWLAAALVIVTAAGVIVALIALLKR